MLRFLKMTTNISKVFQIYQKYEKHSYKLQDREHWHKKKKKTMDKPKRINQINLNTSVSYFFCNGKSFIILFLNNPNPYKYTDVTLSMKY